jgi:transposase
MEPYMRKCSEYSAEFKEKLLAKALSPNAPPIIELARKSNIPYPTLYAWIYKSKQMNKAKLNEVSAAIRPKDKTAEAKLQAVIDTFQMTEEERGAYCRKHGFYTYHLNEWKKQVLMGLNPADSRENKAEQRQLTAEIKQLKSELNRKEKALAEASALLILKKKASLIWGDSEGD